MENQETDIKMAPLPDGLVGDVIRESFIVTREEAASMLNPCKICTTRKTYARLFDVHFSGEDCPYECDEYEKYKEAMTNAAGSGGIDGGASGELRSYARRG